MRYQTTAQCPVADGRFCLYGSTSRHVAWPIHIVLEVDNGLERRRQMQTWSCENIVLRKCYSLIWYNSVPLYCVSCILLASKVRYYQMPSALSQRVPASLSWNVRFDTYASVVVRVNSATRNIQWCVSQTQQNVIMFIIVLGQHVSGL